MIATQTRGLDVHSAYFHEPKCYDLMRSLLRGIDRSVLVGTGSLPSALPKPNVRHPLSSREGSQESRR